MHATCKILLISNYYAPDAGAAAVRLTRLAENLVQMGHEVTVLTSMPHYPEGQIKQNYRGTWTKVEIRNGVRVVQVWLWATPSPKISRKLLSQLSFMLMAFIRGMGLKQPDVVLIEAQPIFTGFAGVGISFFKRRPYVLNISDLWPDHLLSVGALTEKSAVYRVARALVNAMYRRAKAMITMSPAWEAKIRTLIATPPPIHTILNGVDLERFKPNPDIETIRQEYNLSSNKLVVFIGTFATQYNFDLMLDMAEMLQQRQDVTILFIGQGSQQTAVERFLQSKDLPRIRWIQWLPHEKIPLAWNSAYLTFWAMGEHELYEGTIPAKMFEAMACGVPLVIYSRGVMQEIIQASNAGVVISTGGAAAFAADIATLLDNEDQRDIYSQNARTYALENFEHKHVTQRYADVLKEVSS